MGQADVELRFGSAVGITLRDHPDLRVVVLCCDGPYQRYLVRRLDERYRVTGVVVYRPRQPKGAVTSRLRRYRNPVRLVRHLVARLAIARSKATATPLVRELFGPAETVAEFPAAIDLLTVANINDPEAVAFVERHRPDVVCVNGTNLLRGPMLALIPGIPLGIINLHTGLSPYTRGGNCNLYALLEGRPEWVGVTVHHIDPGIDSGDLILTAQVPMEPEDDYERIDARTFHHGIDLLVAAVGQLAADRAARVPQWEGGRLYLRKTGFVYEPWQRVQVDRLLRRGMVRDYLANKDRVDRNVRLVGEITR